ncbi:MAG: LysR family transcriptional regulator [Victivallales bacterium]|nr:LysR family transcriptional regulator [Victivallales bacterium]
MELRVLKYFLAVAREKSVTGAAHRLHVTQPTLSRQLKDLEDELGQRLFIRGSHHVSLTAEGMLLRQRAEEIMTIVDKTRSDFSAKHRIAGDVYVGGGESEAMSLLAQVIHDVRGRYPAIRFHLYSGNAEDVMDRLDRGTLDFGVLIQPVDISKYDAMPLPHKDVWGLLMPFDHPLAAKKGVAPDDLNGIPLILSRQVLQYGATENPCLQWLGKPVSELDIAATYNLIFNAALLVRSGVGCAVTLDRLVPVGVNSGLAFRPFVPKLESSLDIVWKKGQFFSPAATAFLDALQKRLETQQRL